MRTIKFRVWDNTSAEIGGQRMISWDELCALDSDGILCLVDVLTGQQKNVIPMQYTGLHDRNGVEIYESDILTGPLYPFQDEGLFNYHGVVEWCEAGFVRVLRCVNPFKRGISDGIAETLGAEELESLEVFENIHENPDLIGDRDD